MADTPDSRPSPRRKSLAKKLLIAAGALGVLLIVSYFFLTSALFLKSFVLPKVGASLGAKVTVEDASISPFSQVILKGLKVETSGPKPLATISEVRLRYGLMQILRGTIAVDEVKVISPSLLITQSSNGASNLDPIKKALAGGTQKPAKGESKAPPVLAIRDVAVQDIKVRVVQESDKGRLNVALAPADISLDRLVTGEPSKLTLKLDVAYQEASAKLTNALQAHGEGAFTLKLSAAMVPEVQGSLKLEVQKAEGALRDARALGVSLDCDLSPAELRNLALRFSQAGQGLGELRVSGPVDAAKSEARLKIEVQSINRQVLNLAGASMGLDFAGTTLSSSNLVEIAQKGTVISARGQVQGRNISVKKDALTTPLMDLDLDYQANVNLTEKSALVQKLALAVRQNKADLIKAGLDRPMTVSWGEAAAGMRESSFQFSLQGLDLADWKAVLGDLLPAGKIDAQLGLVALQDGKQLKLDFSTRAREITAVVGTNRITRAGAQFRVEGQVDGFRIVTINQYALSLSRAEQELLTASGKANYDLQQKVPGFQVTMESSLPGLMPFVPLTNAAVSSGAVKLSALYGQKPGETNISGSFSLSNFTGHFGDLKFQSYQANMDWDAELKKTAVNLNRMTVALRQGLDGVGNFDVNGKYDPEKKKGQWAFNVVGVNERALQPFMAPGQNGAAVASMQLNASGTASYDAQGDTSAKAQMKLANLVLTNATGTLPAVPIQMEFQLDATQRKALATLNQFVLAISTPGADRTSLVSAGKISATGKYDSEQKLGDAKFKVEGLNQNLLAPFLAGSIAPNRLLSASLNSEGQARLEKTGAMQAAWTLSLTNLVTADASGKKLEKPLAVDMQFDAGVSGNVVELRKVALALAPTARATNQIVLTGRLDTSTNKPSPSLITLRSEGLDLTPYYDLVAGKPSASPAPAAKPAASSGPAVEPEPIKLPFAAFTFDSKIDRLFLREVAISNLVTLLKINGGVVELNPLQLTLNGAPVKATANCNVGVKGWTYDVTAQADRIPFEPLARTFAPGVVTTMGNYDGRIVLDTKLKGAGITAASLQRSLAGNLDFAFTNANLQVVKSEATIWFIPINIKLLATFLGVPELMESPVTGVYARTKIGNGQIDVQEAHVVSPAFAANLTGPIQIRDPLTNSPMDLAMDFSLRRSLAQKARLVSADSSPAEGLVALPRLASVGGTLGKPETKTDKVALATLTARTAAGLVGGKAGNAIQGAGNILENVGGLLGGKQPAPSTNAPAATNQTPRLNPLDLLRKPSERKP